MMPLARTPQTKQGAQSLRNYSQKIERALESMTPWASGSRFSALRRKYAGKMPEGSQVLVEFDAHDNPDGRLFAKANEPADTTSNVAEDD